MFSEEQSSSSEARQFRSQAVQEPGSSGARRSRSSSSGLTMRKKANVKSFIPAWMDKSTENSREESIENRTWLAADPQNPAKAVCRVCKGPNGRKGKSFSILEGYTAISTHSKGKIHEQNYESSQNKLDPNQNLADEPQQITMEEAVENAKKKNAAADELEAQLLTAQVIWSNSVHSHGLPSEFFNCSSKLFYKMFPDSEIAKQWAKHGMARDKGDYFGTHGLFPFLTSELIKNIKASPGYSINFDESDELKRSQLNINISFVKDNKVKKAHYTTISMEEGTKAEDIKEAVVHALESSGLSLDKLVNITTDGCSTMLGIINGVHTLFRELVPTLPDWGGCLSHDSSHLLQYGISKLDPTFVTVCTSFHSYLNGVSLHRRREYEAFCHNLGLKTSQIPKHFDIRFRTINLEAHWLEKDDRGLYLYMSNLAEKVKCGEKKDPTETEVLLMEKYLGNYVQFRLTTKFLCDVSDFILKFLNTFEKREPQIHKRHKLLVEFIYGLLGKLLKNAGLGDRDEVTADNMLDVNCKDENIQHSDKDLYIGPKAEEFLEKTGLNKQSPELTDWMKRVREFYVEVIAKAFKYFSVSLKSNTLRYLSILSPKTTIVTSLDVLKKRYKYIARKFKNIVTEAEIPELMEQVTLMKAQRSLPDMVDCSPEKFFEIANKVKNNKYKLVARLGQALLTIYNSSSEAERDFSVQHGLVADPHKNNTSQLRLQARMRIKSNTFELKEDCEKCDIAEEEDEESEGEEEEDDDEEEETKKKKRTFCPCHCSLFQPGEELLVSMKGGQPNRRYTADKKQKKSRKTEEKVVGEQNYEDLGGLVKEKRDLKSEVEKWRRNLKKQKEKKDKDDATKKRDQAEKDRTAREVSLDAKIDT